MQTASLVKAPSSITDTALAKQRRLAMPASTVAAVEASSIAEQLERARLGHNFGAISVFPPDPPIQPKRSVGLGSRLGAFSPSGQSRANPAPVIPAGWAVHPPIQAKLTVGQPNDPYEQEADRVADQVMRMAEPRVQAKCACGGEAGGDGECAACKAQRLSVQRQAQNEPAEAENSVQAKPETAPAEAAPDLENRLNGSRGSGQALPEETRSSMESRFGADFGAVRVHTSNEAVQMNKELGAQAFTHGRDIYFNSGKYEPESRGGKRLLAHELTHVVQQNGELLRKPMVREWRGHAEQEVDQFADTSAPPSYRASGSIILRQVVNTAVARRNANQIFGNPAALPPLVGMSLSQFRTYTQQQADWFVDPTLAAGTNRDDLWKLLLLAEEGPHILSGVGDLPVSILRGVVAADWLPLRAFCRGTNSDSHTVRLFPPLPALADRIALGRTLLGLEAVIPPAVLEVTVSQAQLLQVQTQGLLPLLTTYWADFEPHIEQTFTPTPGARGPEFDRVLAFLNALGAPGLAPLAPLRGANPAARWVRNLHRFPLPMLLRLVANLLDTSGTKRLILLLHTGHDAVAAFQGSAALFSNLVLTSPGNLVLMIEGAISLAAITNRIPAITATWGKIVGGTRRISQVVIAGHGSAQTAGMAGTGAPTVTDGAVSYPEQSLVAGQPATQALLDALLHHMPAATARILYAGCLVGSTHAAAGTAAAAIPGALAANQSLAAFTDARAVAAGIPTGRVQAARASVAIGRVTSLFNPATGNLATTYPFDPNAFGSASSYAQSGHEPEGVLRAAVEVGASNLITAETLLRTRLGMPAVAGDWYDTITRLLVGLALPAAVGGGVNLQMVNELANIAEVPFLAFWPQFDWINAAAFRTRLNPQPFAAAIYTGVAATTPYTTPPVQHTERLRINVDQGWLALAGAAHAPILLAGILTTGLSANNFEAFLDLAAIAGHGAALLPLGGAPTVEQIRLALAWFSRDNLNAHVRSFLSAQVLHPANAPVIFNPVVSAEIAAAGRTDRRILDLLGFASAAMAPPAVGGGAARPLANLALPGSATNTLLVGSRPYLATVTAVPNVFVRRGPSPGQPAFMTLGTGASVHVMGSTAGWAAVDVWGRLGFIRQTDLSLPPP